MALTRAQLLSGDIANGAILSNQPQGVRPGGAGITIGTDGIITVNSQTIQGVMKLGQTPASAAAAFNGYTWPVGPGIAGQQLQTDGTGLLSWSNANASPYTAKGQLVVGIGLGADTLLNVGTNTAALMADSSTASGLIYSNAVTSAMLAPAGNTLQRPNPATPGQFRYNTLTGKFEFATGATSWEQVASGDPTVSTFVSQTVPSAPALATGNALIPAGTSAQRQATPAPVDGSMRFNTDTDELEVFGPLGWKTVPSSTTGAFAAQTIPTAPGSATPNVVIPGGSTTDRQTAPAVVAGEMRFNTTTGKLEVYGGGGAWETLPSATTGSFVAQTDTAGTGAAVMPGGNDAARPAGPAAGYFRYNNQAGTPVKLEYYDGAAWTPIQTGAASAYTGTLPIVVTGTVISINAATNTTDGSMSAADKAKLDGAATIVSAVTGTLPITVATGTSTPLIAINAATTAATGSIQLATQAEAITGTDAVKASTPATAVAKTTADQTGFVVTPKSAAAPTTTGYLHYNTTSNHLEYFAASAAKTALEREGDNMTGKLSVTPSAIAAGVGGWLLTTSNYWTVGALAFPLPTGLSAGQGGLIQMSAAPTSWPAGGGILKYTGGTAPAPTAFPAILPYYSDGTNVYLGKATENIS